MQRLLPIALALGCAERIHTSGEPTATAPTKWAALLGEAVVDGWVDYDLIAARRPVLDNYMAYLGDHGPIEDNYPYSKEDKSIAFYANAYNAAVVLGVLENQPLDSVLDVRRGLFRFEKAGFFMGQTFYIDGQWMDLYTLEHQYLLGQYEDPYIHVMLTCASVGCPPLRYWKERQLDHQQKKALTAFLATEHGLRRDGEGYAVSELFLWFDDQLVDWSTADSVCQFLAASAGADARAWLEAEHERGCAPATFAYDWKLNGQPGD